MEDFFVPDTEFPDGPTIPEFIGVALYWVGWAAMIFFGVAAIGFTVEHIITQGELAGAFIVVVISLAAAVGSWLLGRAALYLLTDK